MSKNLPVRRGLCAAAVWLAGLVTMVAATVFTVQPAAAGDEEWIILSLHDGSGIVRDAVAAMDDPEKEKDKGVTVVITEGEVDDKVFYRSPEGSEEEFDSFTPLGVDMDGTWYGRMALICAGDQVVQRIVYRRGAEFVPDKEIKDIFAGTVHHGYFRCLGVDESEYAPAGTLVGSTVDDHQFVVCVVKVKL